MTLLIDIEHDTHAEPLRLMCGSDFEVLRTDATGLEIYGKSHQGKEYLLFPLHFHPLDAGVLAVRIPAEYHEWFMERDMDGARIIFSTPHGSPFFPDMPEEYHSNTGYLRIKDASSMRVELDRLEPDLIEPARESDGPEQASGQAHGRACGREHGRDYGASCGCGQVHGNADERRGHGFEPENTLPAERALAEAVRAKTTELNALLGLAAEAGLLVRLALEGDGNDRPCLCIHGIFRPL